MWFKSRWGTFFLFLLVARPRVYSVFRLLLETTRMSGSADLRDPEEAQTCRRSGKNCGANPFKALTTDANILKLVLRWTGIQWREARIGVMWSCFLVLTTELLFWSNFQWLSSFTSWFENVGLKEEGPAPRAGRHSFCLVLLKWALLLTTNVFHHPHYLFVAKWTWPALKFHQLIHP